MLAGQPVFFDIKSFGFGPDFSGDVWPTPGSKAWPGSRLPWTAQEITDPKSFMLKPSVSSVSI